MISSKMSSAPCAVGERAQEREEPGAGGADAAGALDGLDDDRGEVALAAAQDVARSPSGSPHGSSTMSPDIASGTPGVPAITPSWVPWYERSNLATSGRPVNARAARMANIVASVPELVKRSRSIDGTRRRMLLGELDLGLGRGREGRPAADLRLDRGDDRRMGMAEDQRGVVAEEVAVRRCRRRRGRRSPAPAATYGGYGAV